MLRSKRAEIVWFISPIVTCWGTLVANEVKEISNEFVWGEIRQFGAISPVPLPGYVTAGLPNVFLRHAAML